MSALGNGDIYEAYKTWPDDIRKKLSLHDLRRMSGWKLIPPHTVPANVIEAAEALSRDLLDGSKRREQAIAIRDWLRSVADNRKVISWRHIGPHGTAYKWNEGAPTEEDRKNTAIGGYIQLAYSE